MLLAVVIVDYASKYVDYMYQIYVHMRSGLAMCVAKVKASTPLWTCSKKGWNRQGVSYTMYICMYKQCHVHSGLYSSWVRTHVDVDVDMVFFCERRIMAFGWLDQESIQSSLYLTHLKSLDWTFWLFILLRFLVIWNSNCWLHFLMSTHHTHAHETEQSVMAVVHCRQ